MGNGLLVKLPYRGCPVRRLSNSPYCLKTAFANSVGAGNQTKELSMNRIGTRTRLSVLCALGAITVGGLSWVHARQATPMIGIAQNQPASNLDDGEGKDWKLLGE